MTSRADAIVPNPHAQFVEAVAQVPRAARWVLPVTALLRRGAATSTVERRVRALVALRMSVLDQADYWSEQQRAIAPDAGVTAEEVGAVTAGRWQELDSLSGRERAALRWTDQVAVNEAKRDKAAFSDLEAQFDTAEIVELTALAGMCALLDRFANALALSEPEPVEVDHPDAVGVGELTQWARSMFDERAQ